MLRVGLTGGIACGKSHVLGRLAAAGLATVDLDSVAHDLLAAGGPAHAEVVAAFGPRVLGPDGGVDRKALGGLVFSDATARRRLNAILHPRVREEEVHRVARAARGGARIVVTDAALLVESGVHLRFDRLVVVHCTKAEQLRRLALRDGIGDDAALARIDSQMPMEEKRRFAHFEIDSSGSLEATDRSAAALAGDLRRLESTRSPRLRVAPDRALGCLVHGPAIGPRGLAPLRILEEIVACGGLEMEGVARWLVPPDPGPWYRAGRHGETGPSPASLVAPLVLWALVRGGPDDAFLAGAAASLARLTHGDGPEVADACLMALVLQDAMVSGAISEPVPGRADWRTLSTRWGGGPPSRSLEAVLAVAQSESAPASARRAATAIGADPGLAGMLVGAVAGVAADEAPGPVVERVAGLLGQAPEISG